MIKAMIISPGRRYIFVHIPKTGGTALSLALEERAKADDILIGDTPKAQKRRGRLKGIETKGRLWKHSTLADIEGLVAREDLADFFCFTLVRNPWDRMVSYYHWLRAQSFDHPAVRLARSADFRGFLHAPQTGASFRSHPSESYMRDGTGIIRPATYVRLEHFEEDFAPVAAFLGFEVRMPVSNSSVRDRDWRRYYDEADRAHLAAMCAADIAKFGYRFDPCGGPCKGPSRDCRGNQAAARPSP